MSSFALVFNTSFWGNSSSPNWAGPSDYKTNPDTLPKACYFKSHRDENFALNIDFYMVLGAKLIFVIVYEVWKIIFIDEKQKKISFNSSEFLIQHLVFCLTGVAAIMVPDVPSTVRLQISREAQRVREAFFELEMQQYMEVV